MDNKQIREPKQQRSIEKKRKIVDAGFQLFCEKGYHNTNTAEIAKLAGVSTGIVYSYFIDKKDIFIAAFDAYANSLTSPLYEKLSNLKKPIELPNLIQQILLMIIESHNLAKSAHEEMQAMAHIDKDIAEFFCKFQADLAYKLVNIIAEYDIKPTHAYEKMHISINIVENLCHEIVYHQHKYINYEIMTDEAIKFIVNMFTAQV